MHFVKVFYRCVVAIGEQVLSELQAVSTFLLPLLNIILALRDVLIAQVFHEVSQIDCFRRQVVLEHFFKVNFIRFGGVMSHCVNVN